MNVMNYDRKALKERAKASLRGTQPRPWKVTLVYLLIASVLPAAVSMIFQIVGSGGMLSKMVELGSRLDAGYYMDESEALAAFANILFPAMATGILSFFVSILMSLVQVVMGYGYRDYALKLYRGEQTAVKDVFSGFSLAGRAICTAIMVGIFTFLWTMLAAVLAVCAMLILTVAFAAAGGSDGLTTLLMLLVYVGVVVCAVFISYRYSLAPYFILTTDMGTMDAIRESKNAMRGNIGRRFVLDLSFLGWALLVVAIVFVVMYGGLFITILTVGYNMVMSGAIPEYMDAAMSASVLTQFMGGLYVSAGVGFLASLPLSLWLTAYTGSAEAGFFLVVTGQDDAPHAAPEYIPPQPSDIWNNVPTPPTFTPSAPQPPVPPAPPAPPQPPVIPAPPEGPAGPGPDDPIPATPAPETPAPETSEAPAEQEGSEAETPAETAVPAEETPVTEAPAEAAAPVADAPSKEEG